MYKRLASIPYDQYAVSRRGEEDTYWQESCRNLKGGLIEGKEAVCAGYAEILRNALALKGIESHYIQGFSEKEGEAGHAWNQVKIGNNWYNVDLTWDRDEILKQGKASSEMLKTDEEFKDHDKYSDERTNGEKCDISIKSINSLANSIQKMVLDNRNENE